MGAAAGSPMTCPEQAAFDAYYQDLSKYEASERAGENPSYERDRAAAIAEFIGRYVPGSESRILEIGCATGRLLHRAQDDRVFSRDRRRSLPLLRGDRSAGVRRPGPDRNADGAPGELVGSEMIVLIGVLEHVRDLAPALERVRGLLTGGGRVYVEVPDVAGFAQWLDAPFQQFSSEHVNYFSTASLSNLMLRNGFRLVVVERLSRKWTETSTMPVIAAVFELAGGEALGRRDHDDITEQSLCEYVAASLEMEARRPEVIESLVASGEPILVWGVGTHTTRLLETTRLSDANIVAFFDSNPKLQGKRLLGRSVLPPSELSRFAQPVLISSRVFQTEIERQIRDELGCRNPILHLYGD